MPVVIESYEHTEHHRPELVGTGATRVLAAAGWLGSAVGYTVAAVVLSKSYRHITSDNWRAALKEIHWLLPLMISSFGMAYLGWVVWATLAAMNGHRVAPLASSPWLPPFAYLVGPAAAAVASIYKPEWNGPLVAGAVIWVCLGHGFVLLSLRSSARRIGADAGQFTKLIMLPAFVGRLPRDRDGRAAHYEFQQHGVVHGVGHRRYDVDAGDSIRRVAGDALVRPGLRSRPLQIGREPASGLHVLCSPLSRLLDPGGRSAFLT